MATVNTPQSRLQQQLSWYFNHKPHSQWDQFSLDDQQQMIEDDLAAGKRVSLVLVSLITAGMLLSIVTLIAVLATK